MEVLPLTSIFEKLQLTVTSAEIVLTSLGNETEIVLSSEISSLPTYNCNMVFRKMDSNDSMIGQMCFRSGRPLVTAEISLNYKNFRKIRKNMQWWRTRSADFFILENCKKKRN
jgi:hypothetical protein